MNKIKEIIGCFFGHDYERKNIKGRPHIDAHTSLICGRDGDIIKKTCKRCGYIDFENLKGTPSDRKIRAIKFRKQMRRLNNA